MRACCCSVARASGASRGSCSTSPCQVATGNRVWRHFDVPEPQPVLYIALEDSRARIQRRLQEIRPGVRTKGKLQLLYSFPMLNDGGLEKLRQYIVGGGYRLIVIDVSRQN